MTFFRASVAPVFLATFLLVSCFQRPATQPPDPQTVLQAIPDAKPAQYEHVRDMRTWKNPYLILRTDGVALLDAADNAEIHLKTDELLSELAKLPASKWPYGRVVAVSQPGPRRGTEQDDVAIRRNKGIVGGILQSAHVAIEWVPSA